MRNQSQKPVALGRKSLWPEKELADLTIAIGLINAYNFIGVGFRLTPAAAK